VSSRMGNNILRGLRLDDNIDRPSPYAHAGGTAYALWRLCTQIYSYWVEMPR